MGKEISVQIGVFHARDEVSRAVLPCQPIFKSLAPKVAESMVENIAMLLVDCYDDFRRHTKFNDFKKAQKLGGENASENNADNTQKTAYENTA